MTAGLAAYALTVGGFAASLAAFGVAAAVLVGLLFAAALTVARAQEGVVSRVQAHAPRVKRWSGAVLIVVGVWFLVLAAFADFFAGLFPI